MPEEGARVSFEERTWTVRDQAQYEYVNWQAEEWTLHPMGPGANQPRYLEREYEDDSDWENWVISRPVVLDDLRCEGLNGEETTIARYASSHEELPDALVLDGERYTLKDGGPAQRNDVFISYHNYEAESGDGFVTIEGDPPDEISAVVGHSIRRSDFSIVERPDTTDEDSDCGSCACCGLGCLGSIGMLIAGSALGLSGFFSHPFWLRFSHAFLFWSVVLSVGWFLGGAVGGLLTGLWKPDFGLVTRRRLRTAGMVGLGFAGACLITVIGSALRPSHTLLEDTVPSEGGTIGPVEVSHDGAMVDAIVEQDVPGRRNWSFVTAELLDENRAYLTSFGGEFWDWPGESQQDYQVSVRVPSKGTFYVRLQTDTSSVENSASILGPVKLKLRERQMWANPLPFRTAAYIAFFLAGLLIVTSRTRRASMLAKHLDDGGQIRYDGQGWRVSGGESREYVDRTSPMIRSGGEALLDYLLAGGFTLDYLRRGGFFKDLDRLRRGEFGEQDYLRELEGNRWTLQSRTDAASTCHLERVLNRWRIERPVPLEDLRLTRADGKETDAERYIEAEEKMPAAVTIEGTRYQLQESGTVRREGSDRSYHTYGKINSGFVTITGDPDGAPEAVVGESVSGLDLSAVTKETSG